MRNHAAIESGRIELKPRCVELSNWLTRLATAFGQANPSHSVVTEVPDDLPTVTVDLDRLGQVMNNLLSNAARYSAGGTQIRVSAVRTGTSVEIDVADQGPGVAPEDCERIFEKFYRGRHGVTLAVRGTGLGLAVARQLVEAHGGTLEALSAPGAGAEFVVTLPLAVARP